MKKASYLLLLVLIHFFYWQSSSAQTFERLRAFVVYTVPADSTSYQAIDSLTYFFLGTTAHDTLIYPSGYDSSYRWHSTDGLHYTPYSLTTRLWYSDNKAQSDTVWQWDTVGHSYHYQSFESATYDASRNLISVLSQKRDTASNSWVSSERSHFLYNSSGKQTYRVVELMQNIGWDTLITSSFVLNSNNTIASTITRNFSLGGGPANYVIDYFYTYDTLGRLDTIFNNYKSNDTSNWYRQTRTIDHYDASGNLNTQLTQQLDSIGGWYNTTLKTNSYDLNHNLIQYIDQNADTTGHWINQTRYQYTYDNYNKIKTVIQDNWDTTNGGHWKPMPYNRMYHYYYQTFTLPTSIAEIAQAVDARIYPVPAAHLLSLDITWSEAQAAVATIYDATGRKEGEWSLPYTTTYHGYIPVAALPEGIYTIEIRGAISTISRSFTVQR